MCKSLAFKISIIKKSKKYKLRIKDAFASHCNPSISALCSDDRKSFELHIPKYIIEKHKCNIQELLCRKKMIESMLIFCPVAVQLDNVSIEIDDNASKKMDLFNQEIIKK